MIDTRLASSFAEGLVDQIRETLALPYVSWSIIKAAIALEIGDMSLMNDHDQERLSKFLYLYVNWVIGLHLNPSDNMSIRIKMLGNENLK
jgi:hypothetical protein